MRAQFYVIPGVTLEHFNDFLKAFFYSFVIFDAFNHTFKVAYV